MNKQPWEIMTDDMYDALYEAVVNDVMDFIKNHHIRFEISVAWDNDDNFEHAGYYDNVDDAMEALIKYKEFEI